MRRLSCVLSLTICIALSAGLTAAAADDAKPAAEKPQAETSKGDEVFTPPEGTDPAELQNYLQKLATAKPAKVTPDTVREHLRKIDAAALEVFGRPIDEQTALMVIDFRYSVLTNLVRFGDEKAEPDREQLVASLSKDERPLVVERGTIYGLASRIQKIDEVDTEARKKLVEDVGEFARTGELTAERIQLAMATANNLEQVGDVEMAVTANNLFAKYLEARNDEKAAEYIEEFKATGRRLGLPGSQIEIKGKTLAGEDFDIAQLKGKVVLVDFWATWCGPCIADMPHVKDVYAAYKDKGFEVVGISLDNRKEDLDAYLKDEKIAWVQLFPQEEELMGWANPIVRYYGIHAIPTAILVDQNGKVVSVEARGANLDEEMEKLLGPADPKPAVEAPQK